MSEVGGDKDEAGEQMGKGAGMRTGKETMGFHPLSFILCILHLVPVAPQREWAACIPDAAPFTLSCTTK
jgi:hypothetical protein